MCMKHIRNEQKESWENAYQKPKSNYRDCIEAKAKRDFFFKKKKEKLKAVLQMNNLNCSSRLKKYKEPLKLGRKIGKKAIKTRDTHHLFDRLSFNFMVNNPWTYWKELGLISLCNKI